MGRRKDYDPRNAHIFRKRVPGSTRLNREWHGNWLTRIAGSDKSTGTKDKEEAQRRANAMHETAAKVDHATSYENLYEFVRKLVVKMGGEDHGPIPRLESSWNEWVDMLLKGGSINEDSAKRYRYQGARLAEHLGKDALIPTISAKDIETYYLARLDSGVSRQTAVNDFRTVRTFFQYHTDMGVLAMNPCAHVFQRALREERRMTVKRKRRPITYPEYLDIIKAAEEWSGSFPDEWVTLTMLGYWTGLRLRDCVDLKWVQVDLNARMIVTKTQKTQKIVQIPISEPLYQHLLRREDPNLNAKLCPNLAKKEISGKTGLSNTFGMILEAAGIDRGITEGTGDGHNRSAVSFHSLRHSLNNDLAKANIDQEVRMMFTGHSDRGTNTIYTHDVTKRMQAALVELEKERSVG